MKTAICEKCGETYPVDIGCVTCRLAAEKKIEKKAAKAKPAKSE
ncbi:unnamed protein product [marine sediment metagenome]|uniref:Uncharacterized protein n=1 Tax=marine sediment metagenome TaxID=412755 RepID=X1CC10_9ZZZZ